MSPGKHGRVPIIPATWQSVQEPKTKSVWPNFRRLHSKYVLSWFDNITSNFFELLTHRRSGHLTKQNSDARGHRQKWGNKLGGMRMVSTYKNTKMCKSLKIPFDMIYFGEVNKRVREIYWEMNDGLRCEMRETNERTRWET